MKLGLGTAQFGMKYGTFNKNGTVQENEVNLILSNSSNLGITYLDTAAMYGESERILGRILPVNHCFNIITKTPHFNSSCVSKEDISELLTTFTKSLNNLGLQSIYGILIHNANDLLLKNAEMLFEAMEFLKHSKLVKKIGVSVYTSNQIEQVFNKFPLDIVQAPVSILDQRLIKGGSLKQLKKTGVEVHARSIFMQGLLLTDPKSLHPYFSDISERLLAYHNYIRKVDLTPIQAAVGFVKTLHEIDVAIVGVETAIQLFEIADSLNKTWPVCDFEQFATENENIINPILWKL